MGTEPPVAVTEKNRLCRRPVFSGRIGFNVKKILGIDVGEVRVGLALSDDLGMMAHPLETLQVKEGKVTAKIAAILRREGIETVVVGLPRNMNGTYGPAADKAREFARKLETASGCRIVFWDERLTTVAAQKSLHAAGRNEKKSRAVIDQMAAVLILQGYLDGQALAHGG